MEQENGVNARRRILIFTTKGTERHDLAWRRVKGFDFRGGGGDTEGK